MNGVPSPHAPRGALLALATCALTLLAAAGATAAGKDSSKRPPAKASSFAPHRTAKRAFGTPIKPPILHKRQRQASPASKGTGTQPTGKETTASRSNGHGKPPK